MKRSTIKILTVFGTRPEVIKLAPFIKHVQDDYECISVTCATTQQRELQNEALKFFNVIPDHDLNIMVENQDLTYISCSVLNGITNILLKEQPNFIVVLGDTTTAFATTLAGFYQKIPVVHIEAGLRTNNIYGPFPEEANRALISRMATLHIAPTNNARQNLLKENIIDNVHLLGNTIVDSLHWSIKHLNIQNSFVKNILLDYRHKILITVHRRENFGKPLEEICSAIKKLCTLYPNHIFIWPVHLNPNINLIVKDKLQSIKNLLITDPLSYDCLLALINSSSLIITDSGGIQEEAATLGKLVIILRQETERVEIVDANIGILVGSDENHIINECRKILDNIDVVKFDSFKHVYGYPGVSKNILEKIKTFYKNESLKNY